VVATAGLEEEKKKGWSESASSSSLLKREAGAGRRFGGGLLVVEPTTGLFDRTVAGGTEVGGAAATGTEAMGGAVRGTETTGDSSTLNMRARRSGIWSRKPVAMTVILTSSPISRRAQREDDVGVFVSADWMREEASLTSESLRELNR